MNPSDLTRIVANGRRAADHLDTKGRAAYNAAAAEIKQSVAPAPYDGPASELAERKPDDDDGFRSAISDPTGNAAIANLSSNTLKHRLDTAVKTFERAATTLTLTILNAVKDHQQHERDRDELDVDNGPGVDWCASCYRDNQHLEPVAVHRDGRIKYRGSCDWCYSFAAKHHREPPVALLDIHHQKGRVSEADIIRAFRKPAR